MFSHLYIYIFGIIVELAFFLLYSYVFIDYVLCFGALLITMLFIRLDWFTLDRTLLIPEEFPLRN